jgi:hypothetical protein
LKFLSDRFDLVVTDENKTRKSVQKFATFLWFDDQADDAVKLRLLPHLELAMLPRTEHMELTTRTSWLVPMNNEFLDAEMSKTM